MALVQNYHPHAEVPAPQNNREIGILSEMPKEHYTRKVIKLSLMQCVL
jgi:hypothetical protein